MSASPHKRQSLKDTDGFRGRYVQKIAVKLVTDGVLEVGSAEQAIAAAAIQSLREAHYESPVVHARLYIGHSKLSTKRSQRYVGPDGTRLPFDK